MKKGKITIGNVMSELQDLVKNGYPESTMLIDVETEYIHEEIPGTQLLTRKLVKTKFVLFDTNNDRDATIEFYPGGISIVNAE
jgi:hypothetical protein